MSHRPTIYFNYELYVKVQHGEALKWKKKILLSLDKANPEMSVKSVVGRQSTMGSAWSSMKEYLISDDQLLHI